MNDIEKSDFYQRLMAMCEEAVAMEQLERSRANLEREIARARQPMGGAEVEFAD
ncbi:hypothetical protein [Sphingomonas sp.]|uniref:hypothetical protein n=1 Tax=Sphingomonas sp. TaxID=28214 RepID=UPI002EDAB172